MSTHAIASHGSEIDQALIRSMETHELRAELAELLGVTARMLRRCAIVWNELECRGEDLSGLRGGLFTFLPLIFAGIVVPEAVVAFVNTSRTLLRAVTSLLPEEQRKLAEGEQVKLVVKHVDGQFTHRKLAATALTAAQIKLVFNEHDRTIRSEAEQIAILTDTPRPWRPNKPVKQGKIVIDRKAGVVRIGKAEASLADAIEAFKRAGVV